MQTPAPPVPDEYAGERLPGKDAVSRQRMPRSLQPADRVDAQNRRPGLPSGAWCQADQSPALPSCASFLPWKDMLSLSFPRLAGKPILVLWLCLRTSSLPVLTGMSNHPDLVSVAGWTGIPPVSGKKDFSVKRQTVQHTNRLRNKNREEPQPLPVRTVSFCAGTSVRPALFAIPG